MFVPKLFFYSNCLFRSFVFESAVRKPNRFRNMLHQTKYHPLKYCQMNYLLCQGIFHVFSQQLAQFYLFIHQYAHRKTPTTFYHCQAVHLAPICVSLTTIFQSKPGLLMLLFILKRMKSVLCISFVLNVFIQHTVLTANFVFLEPSFDTAFCKLVAQPPHFFQKQSQKVTGKERSQKMKVPSILMNLKYN